MNWETKWCDCGNFAAVVEEIGGKMIEVCWACHDEAVELEMEALAEIEFFGEAA